MLNPIAVAIPAFVVAIVAELGVAWRRGLLVQPSTAHPDLRPVYRTGDALADLGCGLVSQVTGLWTGAVVLAGAYAAAFALAPWTLPDDHVATWIGAFVATDFLYYWWHRASHRVNLLWAAHVVHHQSEDYNLAVALRQAVFTPLTSIPFYLPLAILGVSPLVFLVCLSLNTLYQFWIHTRLVHHLGPIEAVFNTPSHHRVHHGINPKYIDRNHAGVFIVWDRWFGTFQAEEEEPVYGVVEGYPGDGHRFGHQDRSELAVGATPPVRRRGGGGAVSAPSWGRASAPTKQKGLRSSFRRLGRNDDRSRGVPELEPDHGAPRPLWQVV